MHKLLIHEATFARIGGELKRFADKVQPYIMRNDGEIRDAGGKKVSDAAGITLGYATPDVWFTEAAPHFMKTILGVERLEWFQAAAAGTEHPVLQMLIGKAEHYCGSHEQAEAIAEWVLWAGFDWLQKGNARRAAQAAKIWQRIEFRELADTHWLVVGFGAIGQATARRLRALGAQVTGVRRTPGAHEHADAMIQPGDMAGVLGEVDAVLLSLPHTDETERMADAAFFRAMRPDAMFVNVGRGMLVDEAAFIAALDAGEIDHASLDVTAVEPLPEDSPIWGHEKITLTPHLSADTMGTARRTDALFLDNLERFLGGEALKNLVSD